MEAAWHTSPGRLLHLGESITFRLEAGVHQHAQQGEVDGWGDTAQPSLTVFPRYLEECREPGSAFVAGGDLDWLDSCASAETHTLRFSRDGTAELEYTPARPGSYLARWTPPSASCTAACRAVCRSS